MTNAERLTKRLESLEKIVRELTSKDYFAGTQLEARVRNIEAKLPPKRFVFSCACGAVIAGDAQSDIWSAIEAHRHKIEFRTVPLGRMGTPGYSPFGSIIEDQKKKDAESIERDVRSVLKRLIDHLDRKDQDDEDDL